MSSLLVRTDNKRKTMISSISREKKRELGQFLTPAPIASFMASLFSDYSGEVRLLDSGAGIGSLTAAFVDALPLRDHLPHSVSATAIEIDEFMLDSLTETLSHCSSVCDSQGIPFRMNVILDDFVRYGVECLQNNGGLFSSEAASFTHCIMNPPYKKIRSDSHHRNELSGNGIEVTNLYAAFLALAAKLLHPGGELVAIVPRSFCNGAYFKRFRASFLAEMTLKHIHVFGARNKAFAEDAVLQENIILRAVKNAPPDFIVCTSSDDQRFTSMKTHTVPYRTVIQPDDKDKFIHIITDDTDVSMCDDLARFKNTLDEIGIAITTGHIVDFRHRHEFTDQNSLNAVPLIYPMHFKKGYVVWPSENEKKRKAIEHRTSNGRFILPNAWYVVTKRFTSKEERRRVVAALCNPDRIPGTYIAFENHVNVLYGRTETLSPDIAKGLSVFLNSGAVDSYFRTFSGHTQVNATDLRKLRYPTRKQLSTLGKQIGDIYPTQEEIDHLFQSLVK